METRNILFGIAAVLVVGGLGYYELFMTGDNSPAPVQNTGAPQAKINIDAVCQGALAYMTFTDAASADAFVAECKDGKHPEVIEQYKATLNVGNGAQI